MFDLAALRHKKYERYFLLMAFLQCSPVRNSLVGTRIGAGVGVIVHMVFTAVFLYFPD